MEDSKIQRKKLKSNNNYLNGNYWIEKIIIENSQWEKRMALRSINWSTFTQVDWK